MKPTIPDEKYLEGLFPYSGLYVSNPFEQQPANTAPVGVNVRANDVTSRKRGGSRYGLTRYIPQFVDGIGNLVQHLNIIVDPQAEALGSDDGSDFAAGDDATRNLRGGVGGYPPIRHRHQPGRVRLGGPAPPKPPRPKLTGPFTVFPAVGILNNPNLGPPTAGLTYTAVYSWNGVVFWTFGPFGVADSSSDSRQNNIGISLVPVAGNNTLGITLTFAGANPPFGSPAVHSGGMAACVPWLTVSDVFDVGSGSLGDSVTLVL